MSSTSSITFRVLAVDDEENILYLFQRIFQNINTIKNRYSEDVNENIYYEITLCQQGDQAVEKIRESIFEKRPFSLIFLDLNMPPGPDGIWTAEQIRKLDSQVEFVLVTGISDYNPHEIAQRIGPPDKFLFLRKPCQIEEIIQMTFSLCYKWKNEKKLLEVNRQLEEKIVDRTRELRDLNKQLQIDIEERKRVEQDLRDSEERFRLISESAKDAIVMIDHEGYVHYWNQSAERIFGYTSKEAYGKKVHDLIAPERYAFFYTQGMERFQRTGEGEIFDTAVELNALTKSGKEIPVELTVSKLVFHGKLHVIAIIRDISERKQAEEELKQSKRAAEQANQAKSQFLANMSHEIRTPMNAIMGMVDLALNTELDSEQREYLDIVKESADALLMLLNDIIDFSKIEAGKLDLEKVEFHLQSSLSEMLRTLSIRARQKNLELLFYVSPEVPTLLIGDPARLRQIIINLVGNAIKFTEEGEVYIHVDVESKSKDRVRLYFQVKDTGIGIPQDMQEQIFNAFEQVDHSFTRKHGGTGLGLSICKRLTQLMKGSICVESPVPDWDPKKSTYPGSVFHFTVEFERIEESEHQEEIEFTPFRGIPILILDDHRGNCEIMQRYLRSWMMRPCVIQHPMDLLSTLETAMELENPFQIVVIDSEMPEFNGLEMIQQLRHQEKFNSLRIIYMTALGESLSPRLIKEHNIASVLHKPVEPSELLQALRIALGYEKAEEHYTLERKTSIAQEGALHILLAEDNVFNQKVIVHLLEKQGHRLSIASNGKETVDLVCQEDVDLILMDVHMPVMDGIEATQTIRNIEQEWGTHIPIIAITAAAIKGDMEKCLEAGMDDYIAKPIKTEQVNQKIAAYCLKEEVPKVDEEQREPSKEMIDPSQIMEHVDGDEEQLKELIQVFIGNANEMMQKIEEAIQNEDYDQLREAAHSLKGTVAFFGAETAREAALQLEWVGRNRDEANRENAWKQVETEMNALKNYMISKGWYSMEGSS